jgi:uncharacterized protein YegP (UPF0339 family)
MCNERPWAGAPGITNLQYNLLAISDKASGWKGISSGNQFIFIKSPASCDTLEKQCVPINSNTSNTSNYQRIPEYITGKDATIGGTSSTKSLLSKNININSVQSNTYINKEKVSNSSTINLLYDYDKEWYVGNNEDKIPVSAEFIFPEPIKVDNFTFATYNGGDIGKYHGWSLSYKDSNGKYHNVLDYKNKPVYLDSAGYVDNSHKEKGIPTTNSEYSNTWRFTIFPSKNVYVYWIKMYGEIQS